MTRSKMLIATLIAVLATGFAFSVQAGRRGNGNGKGHGNGEGHIARMAEELGLSDAQKTKIKGIFEASREKMKDTHSEVRKLHKKMMREWESRKPDKENIFALQKQIHQLKGKLGKERIETRLKVHNVLTKDQREKAAELMKERHENRKDRKNKGERGQAGHGQGWGGGPGEGCPCGPPMMGERM